MRTVAAAAAAFLALVVAAPAQASPPLSRLSRLTLSVDEPGGGRSADLLCPALPGGSHPRAAEACAALEAAGGDLGRLPHRNVICPMVYQSVTARAVGSWRGRTVRWEQEFANACVLRGATGAVFAF